MQGSLLKIRNKVGGNVALKDSDEKKAKTLVTQTHFSFPKPETNLFPPTITFLLSFFSHSLLTLSGDNKTFKGENHSDR